jgi:hypothetical protein
MLTELVYSNVLEDFCRVTEGVTQAPGEEIVVAFIPVPIVTPSEGGIVPLGLLLPLITPIPPNLWFSNILLSSLY